MCDEGAGQRERVTRRSLPLPSSAIPLCSCEVKEASSSVAESKSPFTDSSSAPFTTSGIIINTLPEKKEQEADVPTVVIFEEAVSFPYSRWAVTKESSAAPVVHAPCFSASLFCSLPVEYETHPEFPFLSRSPIMSSFFER